MVLRNISFPHIKLTATFIVTASQPPQKNRTQRAHYTWQLVVCSFWLQRVLCDHTIHHPNFLSKLSSSPFFPLSPSYRNINTGVLGGKQQKQHMMVRRFSALLSVVLIGYARSASLFHTSNLTVVSEETTAVVGRTRRQLKPISISAIKLTTCGSTGQSGPSQRSCECVL